MNSLRIQLLTLFLTSIVILNALEIVFPKIPSWIRAYKARKARAEEGARDERLPKDVEAAIHVPTDTVDGALNVEDAEDEEWSDVRFTGGLDREIILDIERQCVLPKL